MCQVLLVPFNTRALDDLLDPLLFLLRIILPASHFSFICHARVCVEVRISESTGMSMSGKEFALKAFPI